MKLIFPFSMAVLARFCCADGWVSTRAVYTLPVRPEAASLWTSPDPSALAVNYLPDGGEKGGGVFSFRILKPLGKPIVVQGPAIEVPACPNFVSNRKILLKMKVRYPEFVDGSVGICLTSLSGKRFPGLAGNRDFETAYYMGRVKNDHWVSAFSEEDCGITLGGNTKSVSLRPTFDFCALDGKGECLVEEFALIEQDVITHHIVSDTLGNTFFAESGKISVRWAEPRKMAGAILTVRDEEGKIAEEIKLTGGVERTECLLSRRGYYAVEATASYIDGRNLTTQSSAAVVGAALPEEVRLCSRFGLMLCHMSSDFAKKLGVHLISGFFNLDSVKLEKDGTLSTTMEHSTAMKKRDMIYLASQCGGNPYWLRNPATKIGEVYPPTDWKKFAEAVELWAGNNPDMPDYVGAYHEVNGAWRGSDDELVRYYRVFAEAIKKARPEQKISVPTFCNNDWRYLMRLVRKGIMYKADAVNMHPYVNGTAPEKEFITGIIDLQNAMKENGIGNLPIYFTEFGWSCDGRDWQAPVDSLTRARYCARSLILCTARNIAGLVYFAGRFASEEPQEHYWLVHSDYTPWPALAAYCGVTRVLSTVKNGGVYLPLSPNLFMCLFRRGGQSLVVLWTMDGNGLVFFPGRPAAVRSMTGNPLKPAQSVPVSPSPVYIAFDNLKFAQTADDEKDVTELLPCESFLLDGSPVLIPPELQISADRKTASFHPNAPAGTYGTILEKEGKYRAFRYRLLPPFTADYREYEWDGKSSVIKIRFDAESVLKGGTSGTLRIDAVGKTNSLVHFSLNERQTKMIEAEFPVASGERIIGKGIFQIESPLRRTAEVPFDITPITVFSHPDNEVPPDWGHLPVIDFTHWQRKGLDIRERDFGAIPSFVQLYANRKAFYFRVRVIDPEHIQTHGSWPGMWMMDSIQYLFDADTGKPWEVNNINKGYNGHRISQYGASLTEGGETQYWCYQAYFDEGNPGPYGEMPKVSRNKVTKETIYELAIPWKRMGLKEAPKPGKLLGFSLLVNDKDKDMERKMVQFGKAIPNPDPESILQLRLVQP